MKKIKNTNKIMKAHRFSPEILKMAEIRCYALKMNRSEYLSELVKKDFESQNLIK